MKVIARITLTDEGVLVEPLTEEEIAELKGSVPLPEGTTLRDLIENGEIK
jgi:hypothetical protein